MRHSVRGFTLLEIVVALAIAALGIAAVARATGGAITTATQTRERMLAVWVAGNRLAEMRITRAWPSPGSHATTQTMGGRNWYLDESVSATDHDDLRRVDVVVYLDPQRTEREYSVYGFLSRHESFEDQSPDGNAQNNIEAAGNGSPVPLPGDDAGSQPGSEPVTPGAESDPGAGPETGSDDSPAGQ